MVGERDVDTRISQQLGDQCHLARVTGEVQRSEAIDSLCIHFNLGMCQEKGDNGCVALASSHMKGSPIVQLGGVDVKQGIVTQDGVELVNVVGMKGILEAPFHHHGESQKSKGRKEGRKGGSKEARKQGSKEKACLPPCILISGG